MTPFRIPIQAAITERHQRQGGEHIATDLLPEREVPPWRRLVRNAGPVALVLADFALQVALLVVLAVGVVLLAFLTAMLRDFGRPDTAQARAGFERRRWFVRR